MTVQRIWVNGREGTRGLEPDEGFFFGRGVFETIHVTNRALFLEEHLERMDNGACFLGIKRQITRETVEKLITGNGIGNCALKITLTSANTVMTTRPLPYEEALCETGISAMMGISRRNADSRLVSIKSTAYAENLLEREAAAAQGCREAILLNGDGFLAEGSASNLFFVREGVLFTPSADCGLLPGIVRAFVIRGFPVREGRFLLSDLLEADEVFLTNSLMGVMGVSELTSLQQWKIGPHTRAVQDEYRRMTS